MARGLQKKHPVKLFHSNRSHTVPAALRSSKSLDRNPAASHAVPRRPSAGAIPMAASSPAATACSAALVEPMESDAKKRMTVSVFLYIFKHIIYSS